jgi:anti-sigma factor RsiW
MRKVTIGGETYDAGADLPDESLIMAYVDDELDQEGRHYVEDLLARSAEAREIAELMRSSSTLMKSAFLDEPKTDSSSKSGVATAEPARENPNAVPTPPTIKQTRLCRPISGAATERAKVQRKA